MYVLTYAYESSLNDLHMHVRTYAWLWMCDCLIVVYWRNAALSPVWWISHFILHKTLAVFQIIMHIFDILIVGPLILIHSGTFSLQPQVKKQYQPVMIQDEHANKTKCSAELRDLKCDQSFPRRLYWGHKLLWRLQPISSPSPLRNLQPRGL